MTITVSDGGQAVIRFNGKADSGHSVSGNWRVLSSSGSLSRTCTAKAHTRAMPVSVSSCGTFDRQVSLSRTQRPQSR